MISKVKAATAALCLVLLSTALGSFMTQAATEGNYTNQINLLPEQSEGTYVENGYEANIIVNPITAGTYASEAGFKLDLAINPQGVGGAFAEGNYRLELVPEKTFPDVPDLATANAATCKDGAKPFSIVGRYCKVHVNATVANRGSYVETFIAAIYANTTLINATQLTLIGSGSSLLTFRWNATLAYGNYTISAVADTVAGEVDTADNTYVIGTVLVTIPGDVTGDLKVQPGDLAKLIAAYGSPLGIRPYNPNCDLNDDHQVGPGDLALLIAHYGQHYP